MAAPSNYAIDDMDSTIVKSFNEYSKEHNMDIHLNMVLFTDKNTTLEYDSYASTIEYIMKKKSNKYDIFVYDPLNIKRYSPYLEDLSKWLPKEHIDKYRAGDSGKICLYNDEWLALVC